MFYSNKYISGLLIVLFLFIGSCKKFVEIPPPDDKVTTEAVFSSASTIDAAMTGLYQFCFGVQTPENTYYYNFGFVDEYIAIAADDAINALPPYQEFYTNTYPSKDDNLAAMWSSPYYAIGRVNSFIEGITGSTAISEDKKNNYIAQARLIRAYWYFILTNLYGEVPMPLSTDVQQTALLPRASRTSLDSLIMSDLLYARDQLTPDQGSDNYTFNQHTANDMLARMYGYEKNWQEEETAASSIINSGRYTLVPDPINIYTTGNSEAIYQIPNAGNWYEGFISGSLYNGSIILTMTPDLINLFEPGDLRVPAWTLYDGTNYGYNKFSFPPPQPQALVLMRLADVVLLRAEARAQLNDLDGAIDDINLIRERAGVPDLPHGLSQEQTLQAMMNERRKEFFGEGITRWFDLSRWGIMQSTMSAAKPSTWTAKAALFPVMNPELALNPNLTQTPGY